MLSWLEHPCAVFGGAEVLGGQVSNEFDYFENIVNLILIHVKCLLVKVTSASLKILQA